MTSPKWWQTGIFYQIYPRSFADANGDGIGDLRGIINKLDYLKWLGIDVIWLSPHYPSPLFDVGYDVADYVAVAPEYGTLEDFRVLLAGVHQRGMRLIIDFVLNHTSHQHQWFIESKSSRDNPKRDWYVWRDGKGDNPPNNWESNFGGSAWEYDETTGQYYYHHFLKEQPDLNWRNPEVKQAMFDALRFWLDMGVDGLRLDAIGTVYEDIDLRDHSSSYTAVDVLKFYWMAQQLPDDIKTVTGGLYQHQSDLPEMFDLMRDLRKMADEYPDRYLVGETDNILFLGSGIDQLHSVFNFDMLRVQRLSPDLIRKSQQQWLTSIPHGSYQANTLNNHDRPRLISNYGDGKNDAAIARLCAALLMALEGSPYLYYGEEIGMADYAVQSFDEVRDLVSNVYRKLARDEGKTDVEILADLATFSRDRCRTPMQWDTTPNAGFSPEDIKTWLPVHSNYRDGVNVAEQERDESSLLNVYRKLIFLRKDNPALLTGTYQAVDESQNNYLAFLRKTDLQTCLVLLNFSENAATVQYDTAAQVLYSSKGRTGTLNTAHLPLAPFEILILKVEV